MPAVAVTVLDARRRLLLVRDAAMELWALPGGALDPDEARPMPRCARCGKRLRC